MFAFHRFFDFCVAVFSGRAVFWGGGWERARRGVLVGAVMAVVGGGTVAYAGDYEPGSCHEEDIDDSVAKKTKRIYILQDLVCWDEDDFSKEQCKTVVQPCLKWVAKYCDETCLDEIETLGMRPGDKKIRLFLQ